MTHDELADRLEALAEDMGVPWPERRVRLHALADEARRLGAEPVKRTQLVGRAAERREGRPPDEIRPYRLH